MSTTTTSQTASNYPARVVITAEQDQWHSDLRRDGFCVVKGAIPKERAEAYANDMYTYLEDFNLGYNRNDTSTVHKDHLPIINEKGMCTAYGVCHEDFVWKIRTEAGVVSAFQKVYQDNDLIVSFDAVNFGFPNRKDLPPNKPWPHQDQDPTKPGFRVLQGLVNILPNGPKDGGLIVCKGAHILSEQFHKEMAWETPIPAWNPEWYGYTSEGMKWLSDHGCEWVKVCAEPGDLILWDSRAPHYNVSSETSTPRFCVYTCYMPVKDATQEQLVRKKDAFEKYLGTTHWPNCQVVGTNVAQRDGQRDPHTRLEPVRKPVLDEVGFRLTGIPYIKASA